MTYTKRRKSHRWTVFSSLVGYLIKNNRRHAVTWNMGRLFFCFDYTGAG
ncbi:hypothetical protein HMPREF1985_01757 [Mitsuokella sp. oral taxon 131 str. W9106]|nr:hypothetical protein HMPREF1985_01757 [Mitsuokella sp. oral taxon 131 str. W9106]